MNRLFSCAVVFTSDCPAAYLDRELDMSTVKCLVDRFTPLATAGCDIIVNLAGLTFLGTAGLLAMAELQRATDAARGSVLLAEPPTLVWRVLAVAGMKDRFTIATTPHGKQRRGQ